MTTDGADGAVPRGPDGVEGVGDGTVVDARGLRCPLPVIRLAQSAQGLAPGTLLTLWSTDPAAEHDVPAWARMRGHRIESSAEHGGPGGSAFLATTVRLGDRSSASARG